MKKNDFQIVLERRLLAFDENGEAEECLLEIGFSLISGAVSPMPAVAAFRLSPFSDWTSVYGEDLIQAIELAIRMAQSEAEACGADRPDQD